jgi:hypothetical protein
VAPSPDDVALPVPAFTTLIAWLFCLASALVVAPFSASLAAILFPEALAVALFGPAPLTMAWHSVPSTFVFVWFIVLAKHDSESPPALARPIDNANTITTATTTIVATLPLIF